MTAVLPRRRRLAALPATPRYLAGRIGQALLALFGVVTIVFFALRLSG
jgi:peptide/nickel transport system permease protein